jgi:general secretion pathway protein L
MSGFRSQTQLFGLDLSQLLSDLGNAWQAMLAWPILAWMWPKLKVRLWLPSGQVVSSFGPGTPHCDNDSKLRTARFDAVLLPEHLLLRRVIGMPALRPQDMAAALGLQVAGLSPFPLDDLAWAHEMVSRQPLQDSVGQVHVVMASRRLLANHIQQTHPELSVGSAEVWVPSALTPSDVMLPGFGEKARLRKLTLWRRVSALLVTVVIALLAAMAATPTLQLYLRARQAQTAMTALQVKAAPVLKQREALVHATDQLANLAEIMGKPVPPLRALQLVTDALPDDSSLLSLQVQFLKVSMSGQTADATALMKQLGSTPGLRNVTAPTPATKPLGAPRESFSIEFVLDPTQLKSAPIPLAK